MTADDASATLWTFAEAARDGRTLAWCIAHVVCAGADPLRAAWDATDDPTALIALLWLCGRDPGCWLVGAATDALVARDCPCAGSDGPDELCLELSTDCAGADCAGCGPLLIAGPCHHVAEFWSSDSRAQMRNPVPRCAGCAAAIRAAVSECPDGAAVGSLAWGLGR